MVVRVDGEDLAVGGDDLGADQVVDRQAVTPHEIADAAAGRDAADSDGCGVAEADDEPVRRDRRANLTGRQSGAGPHAAVADVEVDLLEVAQVDDDAALGRAVPGPGMSAAAHGELGSGRRARRSRRARRRAAFATRTIAAGRLSMPPVTTVRASS